MPTKIVQTIWRCSSGHHHLTEVAASKCERKNLDPQTKEAERLRRLAATKDRMVSERRSKNRLMMDGMYAGLTVRSANVLRRAGIHPEAVSHLTDVDLLRLPACGREAALEIRAWADASWPAIQEAK